MDMEPNNIINGSSPDFANLSNPNFDINNDDNTDDNTDNNNTNNEIHQAPVIDVVLFFVCGIGCSLCQTAILSCLVYWSEVFGANSFSFLNLCIFTPPLFVSSLQARYDLSLDKRFSTLKTFTFRGCVAFLAGIVSLFFVPCADSLIILCVLSTICGTASSIIFGTLNQMAAFVSQCGRLKMGFSFGYQGAGVVVLLMSLATGFGRSGSAYGIRPFFIGCAFIETCCFVLFLVLIFTRRTTKESMTRRDRLNVYLDMENEEFDTANYWILSPPREFQRGPNEEKPPITMISGNSDVLSFWELWKKAKWCCLSIMVTVASSICMGSWFTQVKTTWIILPQILFFTRIFSDTLGRPPTLLLPFSSTTTLIICCFFRFCFIPIFFLSASLVSFPSTGWSLIGLVAFLSFSSGFLVTTSYQLAPKQLEADEENSLSKLASLLNVCFSIGCVMGVLTSFALLLFL